MCHAHHLVFDEIIHHESTTGTKKHLLLVAGGLVESVGDSLASVAETLRGRVEEAAALLLGRVAAAAGGVAELLGGGLVTLCCGC